jgi:hypothetical protein
MTSTNPIISELGVLLGRGTLFSFLMVVLVLPALLVLFDRSYRKRPCADDPGGRSGPDAHPIESHRIPPVFRRRRYEKKASFYKRFIPLRTGSRAVGGTCARPWRAEG